MRLSSERRRKLRVIAKRIARRKKTDWRDELGIVIQTYKNQRSRR